VGVAIADINDVDIVALYKPWRSPASHSDWLWLFNHVAEILRKTTLFSGSVSLGDKWSSSVAPSRRTSCRPSAPCRPARPTP